MNTRPLRAVAVAAAFLALESGCRRGPVVVVTNASGVTISNVVVSGVGFTNAIAFLAPGERTALRVRPSGDTHVRAVFEAGGSHDSGNLGYLENSGAYRVGLVIGTNGAVRFEGEAR
ncbi:MAG: hypothetical protein ACKOEQ_15625 [Verrucomicrobiota bacterium]